RGEPAAPPGDAEAARRVRTVSALVGRYASLQAVVVDALERALERDEDALGVLLAQAGVPRVEITHLTQALRVVVGGEERAAWVWLLEATPPVLRGATPHQALRQGRIADVQDLIFGAIGGGFL